MCWKPFIDFDSMTVPLGNRVYFIGGRKSVPLTFYDRAEDRWGEERAVEGLKTFGESEGTPISTREVVFFGGSRFYLMGESVVTNSLTKIDVETKTSETLAFEPEKVPGRCFHAQCKYGEFLLISVPVRLPRAASTSTTNCSTTSWPTTSSKSTGSS